MYKCNVCAKEIDTDRKYCDKKCMAVGRLRNNALELLLEEEEKAHARGYTSEVLMRWIKHQIDEISAGKQDKLLLDMWLGREK